MDTIYRTVTPGTVLSYQQDRKELMLWSRLMWSGLVIHLVIMQLTPLRALSHRAMPLSFRTAWKATDGFPDSSFCSFNAANYQGMKNDEARTPVFAQALQQALARDAGEMVILDIGTGPEALLALIAAKAGAKKVYAVEASTVVADLARRAVAAAGMEDVVEVIEGFSTEIFLPEKADLLVAEIVGSVASDEGIYATMHDAQLRHLKKPHDPASYIPRAVETWCAPMSYALHHPALCPAGFDWEAVRRDGPPPRFACSYEAVQPLAEPQLLEEIRFGCGEEGLPAPGSLLSRRIDFVVGARRMHEVKEACAAALAGTGCPADHMARISQEVGSSVSGIAMWPRLVLGEDEDESLHIESRGLDGRPKRSHWQVAMPLLCATPQHVRAGERIRVTSAIELGERINVPVTYELNVEFEGHAQYDPGDEGNTRDAAPVRDV